MNVFGPVPSRRLGRSLGINQIPPKTCCYACVYCQLGPTTEQTIERRAFCEPAEIERTVRERLDQIRAAGEQVDFLSFVPDGEPTLDVHLGDAIERLRPLGIPIAVITNGALLDRPDVRTDLAKADWVSLKVDTVRERMWLNINRPHEALRLPAVLDGMRAFAAAFQGTLATETMLAHMLNDTIPDLEDVAAFVAELHPATAYIAVPTRPPSEPWIEPPTEQMIQAAERIFSAHLSRVALLVGDEGDAFSVTDDVVADILGITAVHPLRADVVASMVIRAGADPRLPAQLVADGQLVTEEYQGETYFRRHF